MAALYVICFLIGLKREEFSRYQISRRGQSRSEHFESSMNIKPFRSQPLVSQCASGENGLKMQGGEEGRNFSTVCHRFGVTAVRREIMKKYFSCACKNRTPRNLRSEAGVVVGSAMPAFYPRKARPHPRSLTPNPLMQIGTVL
jgi:hypothetical protein